ncbi:TenA family protein [Acuticoccus mangrovi]|uniref:TenA family protein n=1 Tax=Acuticoccus mangrovi TaxID=2796142 RepID=A0A934MGP7_9HYPH|nr:TenA family protein [Acuticoccus mangrovi]MBJ3776818.1 TenA family protein [Acuticoccus mangrovi]
MPFSADAWANNAARYETIRTMGFNEELAAGTLSRQRFEHYIVQDAHYLVGFGRALAIAAAKAPDSERIVQFCDAAREAIVGERELHTAFFADWGISPEAFAGMEISPGAHHYISYLVATAYAEPYEVVLASLLPCFWIYAEVGKDLLARSVADNPFAAWIDTYAGEEFDAAVRAMIEATDAAGAGASPKVLAAMHEAFTTATRLEYVFWERAHRGDPWPV